MGPEKEINNRVSDKNQYFFAPLKQLLHRPGDFVSLHRHFDQYTAILFFSLHRRAVAFAPLKFQNTAVFLNTAVFFKTPLSP